MGIDLEESEAATIERINKRNSDAVSEISMAYWEMDAITKALYDCVEKDGKEFRSQAYHLTMALDRLHREIGRQVGAID